jgi:thiamine-monophosphate kinase
VLRSGGRSGDLVYVTGTLGGSIQGKHLDFIPRIAEARWLTENFKLHAMMDLSDGVGADLPRLAKASGCGFELTELPCTPGSTRQQAISEGEDFELLFAISPRQAKKLESTWPFQNLALTRIGSLTANRTSSSIHGFDHFAQSSGNV